MKLRIAFVFLAACALLGTAWASSPKGSLTMMKKPYFTLHLEVAACMGYFEFNGTILDLGVPQEAFFMGAPIRLDLPINPWIRSGGNELLMLLAPLDPPEFSPVTRCAMTLRVRESGSDSDSARDIATLVFSGEDAAQGTGAESSSPAGTLLSSEGFKANADGDVTVSEVQRDTYGGVAAIVSRTVTLPKINLPGWAFFQGDDITGISGPDIMGNLDEGSIERLQGELLPIYLKIWKAFESKKVKDVLPLFEERNKEIDAAFFNKPGTTGKRLEDRFTESVSDSGRKLWPITDDNVMLQVHDNNKLVRLTQNNDKPLLSFDFVEGGAEYFDLVFRKAGDKWIITR